MLISRFETPNRRREDPDQTPAEVLGVDHPGTTVSAKNFVIVLTTNVGSAVYTEHTLGFSNGGTLSDQFQSHVLGELSREFAPEFLNRIDDVVVFPPLPKSVLMQLCGRYVQQLTAAAKPLGYELETPDLVIEHLVDTSDTVRHGARPLQRAVDKHLDAHLAEVEPGKLARHHQRECSQLACIHWIST